MYTRYDEEGWKCNSIEHAKDDDESENGRRPYGRSLLEYVSTWHRRTQQYAYLRVQYSLYQNQAPSNTQCLDRVGKSMCLVCPCNIARSYQKDSYSPMSWRLNQFVQSPILQHKAQHKHKYAQSIEDRHRRDIAIMTISNPHPFQQ